MIDQSPTYAYSPEDLAWYAREYPRQTAALRLVAEGVPYQQIAARMHLAEGTVRLDRLTTTLAPRRWEEVDPVTAVRELTRIVAQLAGALRILTESEAGR